VLNLAPYLEGVEFSFLILEIYKAESLASDFACFIPDKVPDTHSVGGWMGLRAGVEFLEKINIFMLPDATRHVRRFGSSR